MYKRLTRGDREIILSELEFYCQDAKTKELFKKKDLHIHFVGAGGVGMCSLMKLCARLGFKASGSDREESEYTRLLSKEGLSVSIGHRRENAKGASLVVYSFAVGEDNPELIYAREYGIKTLSRAEFLGIIMTAYKKRIGVSGTHGKTTVTAMLDKIFEYAKIGQTTLLGAVIPGESSPLRIGEGDTFLYEACEYRDAFLSFAPTAAVFTNLELDHVDYFSDVNSLRKSFIRAMNMPDFSIVNIDSEQLAKALPFVEKRVVTFGEREGAEYRICDVIGSGGKYSFKIFKNGKRLFDISLGILGRFNVSNACAAAALAYESGIDAEYIESALSDFQTVPRRLEKIGEYNGFPVYYDYAHHPTEIECTIKALREVTHEKITVIFKPHTYSRTQGLMSDFVEALSLADRALLCDISAIREKKIDGVSSEKLAELIGNTAIRVEENDIKNHILNGVTVIMGAADLNAVKDNIIKKEE